MSAPVGGLFPPEAPSHAEVRTVVQQSPVLFGHPRTRWTLALLRTTCPSLAGLSLSGVWRRLARARLARKRSRDRLHSPDLAYREKAARVDAARAQAQATPTTHTLLYGDEFTYYRQPAPASAYWPRGAGGHRQPLAQRSYRANTKRRVVGALDAVTGQVLWASASKMGVVGLRQHLRQLRAAYGPDRTVTLVWDNWPIHTDPRVCAEAAAPRITLLFLPTYAPWLNPIEKLWDGLKATVLRLHPWSDAWDTLHTQVAEFLDGFATGSPALLQAVGLRPQEPTERQSLVP